MSDQTADIARLRHELEQQKSDFQTMEVSLVSRIADVDDDRRHAATRLQRTLQNHRDEIDIRMKRQNAIVTTALILVVVIVGVLLVFVYAKFDQARQTFADEVAELRQTLDEAKTAFAAPQVQPQTRDAHEKLAQLSLEVEAISNSLERLAEQQKSLSAVRQAPQAAALPVDPSAEPQVTNEPNPPRTKPQEPASPAQTEDEETPADTETTDQTEPPPPPSASPEPREDRPEIDKAEQETRTEHQPEAIPAMPAAPPEPSPESMPADAPESSPTTAITPESDSQASAADSTPTVNPANRIPVGDTPFSVQLLGFYSLDSLQAFAQRHGLKDWMVYDQETYQGRPWYVLIESLHATRESAEAAAAALPPELDKFDIWIRKLDADDSLYRPEPAND